MSAAPSRRAGRDPRPRSAPRLADHRLAGAALADQRANLARLNGERHRAQHALTVWQHGAECAHFEAGFQNRAHRSTGSKRAFNPSPNWLKESTVRINVISGNTSTHQAWWIDSRPSAMMPPQVGSSVEIDRLTKDRIASTMTAMPISSDSSAITEGTTLGSTSRSMMPMRP